MKRTLLLLAGFFITGSIVFAGALIGKEQASTEEIMPEPVMEGIHWFHHASLLIETGGKVIYIDPYDLKKTKPADLILITHEHFDHCSTADIKRIAKKETLIICPRECVKKLSGYKLKTVKPGDRFKVGGIQGEAVPAYNRWKPFHRKKDNKVGYILDLNGVRIYHAGDTDYIPEMKGFKDITIAMVPVGGFFAMGPKEAAEAVKAIKPKIAVPIHYGYIIGSRKNDLKFKEFVGNAGIKVIIPEREQ